MSPHRFARNKGEYRRTYNKKKEKPQHNSFHKSFVYMNMKT